MKKTVILILGLVFSTSIFAQPDFIAKGRIEFEKKINLHRQIESSGDEDNAWVASLKKTLPQHKSLFFYLYFDGDKTLYKPGKDDPGMKVPDWMLGPGNDNIVYTDLSARQSTSQKAVFENTYLFQDSLRKIQWKLTDDTRMIAGFECRKATGIIMDSIYVFAFYTDQIMVSGGPESFTGLPGMILGIAIPRISTTWFATKLELVDVKPTDLAAPKRGKKTNSNELTVQLKELMKNWGKWGQRNMWNIFI